jgi:hypothetical protein
VLTTRSAGPCQDYRVYRIFDGGNSGNYTGNYTGNSGNPRRDLVARQSGNRAGTEREFKRKLNGETRYGDPMQLGPKHGHNSDTSCSAAS